MDHVLARERAHLIRQAVKAGAFRGTDLPAIAVLHLAVEYVVVAVEIHANRTAALRTKCICDLDRLVRLLYATAQRLVAARAAYEPDGVAPAFSDDGEV